MLRRALVTWLALSAAALLAACGGSSMANPASVYCAENGGQLEIRQDASGGEVGFCVFPDGSECEEWAYFRDECQPGDSLTEGEPDSDAGMANPASVYCAEHGGQLEIRQDASGGEVGFCVFPDGSECEEWAYLRGECQPGGGTAEPDSAEVLDIASDGCQLYRNTELGYTFHYPADATILQNDDPLGGITIEGEGGWPAIYISHPQDRAEYLPAEGADLETWLLDHNLLMASAGDDSTAEVQQGDALIAGTTAIHTRLARSPQTYAYDKYFFARSGQLYVVVILHTNDQEDWELYNHFLENIVFEG